MVCYFCVLGQELGQGEPGVPPGVRHPGVALPLHLVQHLHLAVVQIVFVSF